MRPSRGRVAAVVVVAGLLAVEVSRLTIAGAFAETRPLLAERLAPQLPDVLVSVAMAQVGETAALGGTPKQSTMQHLRQLARIAPLHAEPFLVQAAIAQRAGENRRAEQLLLQARRRDPRSAAARYLLADAWLREGRISDGLGELAILAQILPGTSVQLVPALAEFARSPGSGNQLKRALSSNPRLKRPLLTALAADPDNLGLILDLDRSVPSSSDAARSPWKARLLTGLINQGDYERAYALWQRFAGLTGPRPLLFNGAFRQLDAPPPFNWSFASTGAGFTEPQNGSMRVLYYGREDATLASQMLLLPPGAYRLSYTVSGTAPPRSLVWTVSCAPSGDRLMELDLGSTRGDFQVPATGCAAQTLMLNGRAQDMPAESDGRLGPVTLERLRS